MYTFYQGGEQMKVDFTINEKLSEDLIALQVNQLNQEVKDIIRNIEYQPLILKCVLNKKITLYPMNHFIRIFTSDKKVFGVTTSGTEEVILNYRLYELVVKLPDYFIRISNTEIININYLLKLELTKTGIIDIYLKNNSQTSSSRRYLSKIKERLL